MAIRSYDLLDVAEHLLELENEAAYRSAISRAYYAAFWEARAFAPENERFTNNHKFVWDCLKEDYTTDGQSIGDIGTKMRHKRNRADYDEYFFFLRGKGYPVTRKDAETVIQDARDLIEALATLEDE
ncbi:MAG: hypothetical protein OHK0029_42900 [Armatimonadaceae bacterium]